MTYLLEILGEAANCSLANPSNPLVVKSFFDVDVKISHKDSQNSWQVFFASPLWLLTYADTLSKSEHADTARHLREYVLFNLRSRLNEQLGNAPIKKIKNLLRPEYLALQFLIERACERA